MLPELRTKGMLGFPLFKEDRDEEEPLCKEQIVSILRDANSSTVTATARRDRLRQFLERAGVRTIIQWGGKAVHQFEKLGFKDVRLPYTERMFEKCMLLPMNTSLGDEDVAYIIDRIQEFYGDRG